MAIFDGKFIRGVVGDVVFRKVGDSQRMSRRVPKGAIKQTTATRRASNTFGLASSLGACLREVLKADLKGFVDTGMHSRLTAKLYRIFSQSLDRETKAFNFQNDSFKDLEDFGFNNRSALLDSLGVKPMVTMETGAISLLLPSLRKLRFPQHTISCEMTVSVTLIALEEGIITQHPDRKKILIEKSAANLNPYRFSFDVPPGCLCIVSMVLDFYMDYKSHIRLFNSKKFSPAAICGAIISPGKFTRQDSHFWVEMPGLKASKIKI